MFFLYDETGRYTAGAGVIPEEGKEGDRESKKHAHERMPQQDISASWDSGAFVRGIET